MPARLSFDPSGVPRADAYDDPYHSADGGLGQARHVFLQGSGLPERWRGRRSFTIIETGFGLGLNFLSAWAALRADPLAPSRLNYVSVEKHPLARADLEAVHARWPQFAEHSGELHRSWPPLIGGFHRLELGRGRIALTLLLGDAAEMLAELTARADALFLDGFSPEKNPDMWSDAVFSQLARLSVPGTTAATWTVAGAIRERLTLAGFRIEKRPGYGRKREMLSAVRVAENAQRSSTAPQARRHAAIIGAGLAGVWCAHALTQRGWQVDLIERHKRPAREASGNAVGALRPALNLADNDNARLARAAFLLAARSLANHPELTHTSARTGVLHLATTVSQAERMARILAEQALPADYVLWIDTLDAARLAGQRVAGPGWWIPLGGWSQPARLCDALLDLASNRITRHFGREVSRLSRVTGGWRIHGSSGAPITEAPVLILANAYEATRFMSAGMPLLIRVRGQVSHIPPAPGRRLGIVVCGDGYIAPLPGGGHCVGATFQPDDTDDRLRTADHAQNLDRLGRMLPDFAVALNPTSLDGRAALRTATADRLPACGPIASGDGAEAEEDLHLVVGLGARGLIWAPLCAEILASRLDGEPNPVERSLAAAMNPARLAAPLSPPRSSRRAST